MSDRSDINTCKTALCNKIDFDGEECTRIVSANGEDERTRFAVVVAGDDWDRPGYGMG